MGTLNETANADRFHIGIFGCRNVGKSSLINAITNQEVDLISDLTKENDGIRSKRYDNRPSK